MRSFELSRSFYVAFGFNGCVAPLQGKGIILTSEIGNVRHSFKCRDRTSLLAAFAELQVNKRTIQSTGI